MAASNIVFDLDILEEVDSTNNHIKRAIRSDCQEGYAVLARRQTSGYGRRGHGWKSPEGGMYLSCLLRPMDHDEMALRGIEDLPTLSLVVSLAVKHALCELVGGSSEEISQGRIKVKWPNDVMVEFRELGDSADSENVDVPTSNSEDPPLGDRVASEHRIAKICGISLESIDGAICVGIGINVHASNCEDDRAASDGRSYALAFLDDLSSIEGCHFHSIEDVAACVLEYLSTYYSKWLHEGFVPFISEFDNSNLLYGREVVVEDASGDVIRCLVKGVDEQGSLVALDATSGQNVDLSAERSHIALCD